MQTMYHVVSRIDGDYAWLKRTDAVPSSATASCPNASLADLMKLYRELTAK